MDKFEAALQRSMKQKFDHMGRTALYFTNPAASNPKKIKVIVTDRFTAAGDMKGTSFNYAEIEEVAPTIEFLRSEVEPARNAYVSITKDLGYRIDVSKPSEEITVTAKAVRLRPEELRNFPIPEVGNV